MQSDRERCIEAGMNDYLAKPIDPDELWKALLKWSQPRQGSVIRIEQEPIAIDLPDDIAGLDIAAGLRRVVGKKPLYLTLLRKFATGQREMPQQLRAALAIGDEATAERLAHTVKALAGNIGALELQRMAEEIEQAIREKMPRYTVDRLADDLAPRVYALIDELERKLPPEAVAADADIDPTRFSAVCSNLQALLSEHDARACDVFEEHARLFESAFKNDYDAIKQAIGNFDFGLALAALQQSRQKSDIG
jgi:two-component system sensor histidine kinase/response regulator